MPRIRLRSPRWLTMLFLATSAPLVLATLWLRLAYPGFTEMLISDIRHGGWQEAIERYRYFYYYADTLDRLRFERGKVENLAEIPPPNVDDTPFEQGMVLFHRGEFGQAVSRFRQHLEAKGASERGLFWLSQALMRRAEVENCLGEASSSAAEEHLGSFHKHTRQRMCSLPLPAHHHQPDSMAEATHVLETLLDRYAPADPLYLWLLNFAYMAQGRYPEEVPPRYLVETEFTDMFYGSAAVETRKRFPWLSLHDRAIELGVDLPDAGKGVAVEDFDGDGDLDLVTGGTYGHLHLFLNRHSEGGLGFVDATGASGLSDVLQPFIVTAADYDADGAMDLFVSRPNHHFQLLRNHGSGRFHDVTFTSGLLSPDEPSRLSLASTLSAWGDVNRDGWIDLVVAQAGVELPKNIEIFDRPYAHTRLYLNKGGTFVDQTESYGLKEVVEDRLLMGAAFGDFDGDGWVDLMLSAYTRGRSRLLRNHEGHSFIDTGLVGLPEAGFTTAFFDIDHDGRLDIFQGGQSPARTAAEAAVFRRNPGRNAARFFLRTEHGFEVSKDIFSPPIAAGTMGSGFGDLDNDGCLDAYLGTGNPESWYLLPNLLYLGERDATNCVGRMAHASMLEGVGTIQKGHGIVFFDFDDDGDQDVYSSLGGMWQGDAWPNQLWVNESDTGNAWTKIRLRGRQSNRWGLGSTISIEARNADGEPIRRHHLMDNGTGFGSAPYLAHIGLLDAVVVERATVTWLGSGCVSDYEVELGRLQWLDESDCLDPVHTSR
ncbi:MAG: VCBS repeat-containing protein [Thermoanaerobaculia bacterium]|nr:VCBS repeat-containing protein [Thermoanaerobaculia bacterium]